MEKRKVSILVVLFTFVLSFMVGCARSVTPGDPARGKALFADTSLGSNGKSCNTCHSELGRGANSLVGKNPYDHTIRDCIQAALQGDPGQEQAVADLRAYIGSLK